MKRKIVGKTVIVALALVGAACAHRATRGPESEDTVLLRFHPQPGRSYRMMSVMEQSTSQTSMGHHLHTHQVVTSVTRYDVGEPTGVEGPLLLRTTLESVHVERDDPGGHVTYDSSDSSSWDVPWKVDPYAVLVGRTYTVKVAADGTRTLEGMDSLMSDLLRRMKLPPGVSRRGFRGLLTKEIGEGAPLGVTQKFGSMLPDHAVSVGESWTRSLMFPGPLPFHHTLTLTLRERRNGVAVIDMRSETAGDNSATSTQNPMSLHMAGTGTGTIEIDEATGWTLRSTMESDVTTILVLEHSPAGRQEIPITAHVVVTTRPAGGD